jgi:SRSO17 transposase
VYGENATFESTLAREDTPFVLAVRPAHGVWAPEEDPHAPPEAAREIPWASPQEPGGWTKVERRFRDGHSEAWWAADLTLASYRPQGYFRLVAATTDPATLPVAHTWYLVTNLPHPELTSDAQAELAPADLAEIVRLYGLRQWVEQGYRQVKGALGWADFEVRSDRAIRRHWQLVCCAFSFCWWAYLRRHDNPIVAEVLDAAPVEMELAAAGGERGGGVAPVEWRAQR